MRKVSVVLILLVILGGGALFYWGGSAAPAVAFRTAPIERGDLLITISATGTVEPVDVVDVGAQVAGRIIAFGQDPKDADTFIDYGTEVEQGTILARIDDSLYAADVAQASAQVEQAKADVRRAEADLAQMGSWLLQAENNWTRAQELGPSRALATTDYESYRAAYEVAKATVAVGEATVAQAQKRVLQVEAALKRAQANLDYCTIKSPVNGVIIDRRVNIGQTVVASLNAPSLFLIARDLKRLQVWVAVNEADIGSIRPGQAVTFTVDAYPGRVFRGEVAKVRLNATMTQNVVTYTVEINTDNSDGKLLPYLTANVLFEVDRRQDVLRVPNAALRWMPEPGQTAPDARGRVAGRAGDNSASASGAGTESGGGPAGRGRGQVWVRDGVFVRPIDVSVGLSDGTSTEIEADDLTEGMEIVVGEAEQSPGEQTTNPFTPRLFRRRAG